jgi:molybdate transport system ATP-binding protein
MSQTSGSTVGRAWSSTAATFRLDIAVSVAHGEVVALLGPNGAGKTTALRALAGYSRSPRAMCTSAGRHDTSTPPHLRPVGVVFQDYLLFPHLSALDNVAFGPRRRGLSNPTLARAPPTGSSASA